MATIELNDNYTEFVNFRVQPYFAERGIEITQRAQQLLAFTMQCQVDEEEMNEGSVSAVAQRLLNNNPAEVYVRMYGHRPMSFNRAFHLLANVGNSIKFPFGPTRPAVR